MPDSKRPMELGGLAGVRVRLEVLDAGFFELPEARELGFVVLPLERDDEPRDRAGEDALVAMWADYPSPPEPQGMPTPVRARRCGQ